MLRVTHSTSAKGAEDYFKESLLKGDYYATGEQTLGQWGGKASERLGLKGDVSQEDFVALCNNRTPEGKKLNPRDSKKRKVGYDLTFSAPKSVSIAYAITGDERIREAFEQAVEDTMRQVESEEMRTQTGQGKNKKHVLTGNMVWASFTHKTARPVDGVPDPFLHRHCYAFNTSWYEDKQRFQAGEFGGIKSQAPFFEASFDARLSQRLKQLGYQIEIRGHSFELKGIERSTIDKFSRRTQQIEKAAKEKAQQNGGYLSAKDKDQLGAKTRSRKDSGVSYDKLRETWLSWLTEEESGSILNAHRQNPRPSYEEAILDSNEDFIAVEKKKQKNACEAVASAVRHCFERRSVMEEKRLMGEALKFGYSDGVLPEDIQTAMKQFKFYRKQVGERVLLTTEEAVQEEKKMMRFCRHTRGYFDPINQGYIPKADFLNKEQKAAITHALSSIDQVSIISGSAGVGKTTLMKEVKQGIEERGKKIFGFAPSAAASRGVMREEGFENADTIARLLIDRELQEKTRNQVIWVDEAGLIGNKDMNRLFHIAREKNARIILTGDIKQHRSVNRGDALRILEERGGIPVARVYEVQRQRKSPKYKKVVELIANDKIEAAISRLSHMRGIVQIKDQDKRLKALVKDYMKAVSDGKSALIVSPVHKEANLVTKALRDELKASRRLGKQEQEFLIFKNLNLTEEEKYRLDSLIGKNQQLVIEFHQNARGNIKGERLALKQDPNPRIHSLAAMDPHGNDRELDLSVSKRFTVYRKQSLKLAEGDRIRITKGGKTKEGYKVNNGDLFTIKGFTRKGDILLENGRTLSKDFAHLTYGYCTTSHSSQGKTVDRVFIAQSQMSSPAASKQQFYVSLSRGKEQAKIYTDDKIALERSVMKDGRRMTASEVADQIRLYQIREMIDQTYSSVKSKIIEPYAKRKDRQIGD